MKHLLAIAALLALTACGGTERPSLYTHTGASVLIDYTEFDLFEATDAAQRYCTGTGGHAQYVRSEEQDDGFFSSEKRLAVFNCTAAPHAMGGGNAPIVVPIMMPQMQPVVQTAVQPVSYHTQQQVAAAGPAFSQAELAQIRDGRDSDDIDWDAVLSSGAR